MVWTFAVSSWDAGRPVPQGDRHRREPLAGRDPGDRTLDQVGGGLGHLAAPHTMDKTPELSTKSQEDFFLPCHMLGAESHGRGCHTANSH